MLICSFIRHHQFETQTSDKNLSCDFSAKLCSQSLKHVNYRLNLYLSVAIGMHLHCTLGQVTLNFYLLFLIHCMSMNFVSGPEKMKNTLKIQISNRFIFFFSIVFQDRNNKTDEKMKTISIKQKVVIDQQCLAYDDVEYNATYDKLLKTTFGNLPCCMKVVVKLYVKQ